MVSPFIRELARRCPPGRVALPESTDPRVLAAATKLLDSGMASSVTLLGPRPLIEAAASSAGIRLDPWLQRIVFAEPVTERTQKLIAEVQSRKGKNLSPETLSQLASSQLCQAGELLWSSEVDCVVAGAVATTADVIRAAISTVGLARGLRTVSGSFVMRAPDRDPWIYADCGVVIEPTVAQLVDIASASLDTWRAVSSSNAEPVVAFLSFSTKGSAQHPSAEKMAHAAAEFRQRHPDVASDGELQFDAAFDPAVGARKAPGSPAAGVANIFIFPDLGAGNLAYKITQRLASWDAWGPILQGISKPFHDLSRGASVDDIVSSAVLALLRGQIQRGQIQNGSLAARGASR
jgi:phosphate acetyltransferase